MRYLFPLLAILILLVSACDRFDSDFPSHEDFFTKFSHSVEAIPAGDSLSVLTYLDNSYLQDGMNREERIAYLKSLSHLAPNTTFTTSLVAYDKKQLQLSWRLTVLDSLSSPIWDSTFTENLTFHDNKYFLYGNQQTPIVTQSGQRVLVEVFTGTWCPNCPVMDEWLHDFASSTTYAGKLYYLEYHIGDPIDSGNSEIYSYYGYPAAPTGIVQGKRKVSGTAADNQQILAQLFDQNLSQSPKADITSLSTNVTGNTLSITGRIANLNNLPQASLKLKYAVTEKVSPVMNYTHVQPCRNVVLYKGEQSMEHQNLSVPFALSVPITTNLPDDAYLVIWLQKAPSTWDDSCEVYNVIEIPIQH